MVSGTWKLLKHTAITDANGATEIDSGTFDKHTMLRVVVYVIRHDTNGMGIGVQFNDDGGSGNKYTYRNRANGSVAAGLTSKPEIFLDTLGSAGVGSVGYGLMDISNEDGQEKMVLQNWLLQRNGTGNNAPSNQYSAGKWQTTSGQISSIQITNGDGYTGKFAQNSFITIYGAETASTIDERPSNVPENTRFEATNLRKIYRRALGNASIPDLSSSTGWTEVDAGSCTFDLDTSNEKIDFSSGMNSSFSGISYDLQTILGSGTNASDTKWILRFKLTPTSTPPNDSSIAIMLSSGQNETTGTSADRVGFYLYTASNWNMFDFGGYSTGGTQFYTDGSGWGASLYGNDTSIAKGTDPLYIEIKRTSTTSATMSITTNSDYTTGAYTKTTTGSTTLPSTVQNLRYLTFQNAQNSTNSNRIAGKIEDIKFYNDITTPLDDRWIERNTA